MGQLKHTHTTTILKSTKTTRFDSKGNQSLFAVCKYASQAFQNVHISFIYKNMTKKRVHQPRVQPGR